MEQKISLNSNRYKQANRESAIELLKIIAVLLIIIRHVIQTLFYENSFISYHEYVLDLSFATTKIQMLVLSVLAYCGAWGNDIFFICSAWFFLQSKKVNKKKWVFILIEIWTISTIILLFTYFMWGGISNKLIIKCILPTIFGNNWYMTCYLLFYPIHPILNGIIERMSKQELFRISIVMFVLYFGFDFIKGDLFYPSQIILWIAIYFIIAYIKCYLKVFIDNINLNVIVLILGISGNVGLIFLTNYLGLHFSFFEDKLLHWCKDSNPFLLIVSIAILNIARNIHFENCFINYVSKLSMLIYIIHENLILRTYFRPYLVNYIYQNYGYSKILIYVPILVMVIFIFSAVCAAAYKCTLQKIVYKLSGKIYIIFSKIFLFIESCFMKFN